MCREAFLLIAVPALFRARQEYTASWDWLFFPVTTLRKKRLPSGRMMGRDWPSIFSGSRGMPLRSHWIDGSGVPSARQESVAGLPTRTTTSDGWCTIRGEASSERSLEPKKKKHEKIKLFVDSFVESFHLKQNYNWFKAHSKEIKSII